MHHFRSELEPAPGSDLAKSALAPAPQPWLPETTPPLPLIKQNHNRLHHASNTTKGCTITGWPQHAEP